MLTIAQELEAKTNTYWVISQSQRGHGVKISSGDALTSLQSTIKVTNPQRLICHRLQKLTDEIIRGGRRKKAKANAKVLQLHRRIS